MPERCPPFIIGQLQHISLQRKTSLQYSSRCSFISGQNVLQLYCSCTHNYTDKPRLFNVCATERRTGVRIPVGVRNSSLSQKVQTDKASYPISIGCIPGGVAAGREADQSAICGKRSQKWKLPNIPVKFSAGILLVI